MAKANSYRVQGAFSPGSGAAPEMVDPRWLLRVLGLVVAVSAVSAYLALCYLIYQGAWQLFLHPSSRVDRTPAALSIRYDAVRFDSGATGRPRLSAWWIPAASSSSATLLYLHDGKGSLGDTVDELASLHGAGVNVLAFDYRGFGASDPTPPNEARMTEDARAALDYLTESRHLDPAGIVPYGVGLGAALATSLAVSHPELRALILDNPDPDAGARVLADHRSRWMPVRVLVRDRFDLSALSQLRVSKLLLVGGPGDTQPRLDGRVGSFFRSLPDPRFIVTLAGEVRPERDVYAESVRRFVDALGAGVGKK